MWYIILSLIAAIYILINLVLPGIIGGFIGAYVIVATGNTAWSETF